MNFSNQNNHRGIRQGKYITTCAMTLLSLLSFALIYQLDAQRKTIIKQKQRLQELRVQISFLGSNKQKQDKKLERRIKIAKAIISFSPGMDVEQIINIADIIDRESYRCGIDWELLLAIINTESEFNPRAKSPVGALGLMQVMPQTACDVASKAGVRYEGAGTLYNPEKNIKIGTYYLHTLIQRFEGDWHKALAAYNYGPTKVKKYAGEGRNIGIWYRNKVLKQYDKLKTTRP